MPSLLESGVKQKLTIITLGDKEFDRLPYKHAKTSVGLAVPKENKAYIRITSDYAENRDTFHHELEELLSDTSAHEEDGVRYKKKWYSFITRPFSNGGILDPGTSSGGGILGGLAGLALAPFTGGSSLMLSGLGGALGGGIGGYQTGGVGGALSGGLMGGLLGAGIGSMGSGMAAGWRAGASAGQTGLAQAGSALRGGLLGTFSTPSGPISLVSKGGAPAGIGGVMNKAGAFLGGGAGNSILSGGTATAAAGKSGSLSGILSNPMTMLGLGGMALSALPISPSTPNIGEISSKWLTSDAVTRAGKIASGVSESTMLGDFEVPKETTALISTAQADIKKAYAQRAKDLDRQSSSVNENWMQSGERLEMHRRLQEQESTESNKVETELLNYAQQTYAQQKYGYVMQSLGADEATKRDLLYGDISTVILKYNADREDIMALRQMAANAGLFAFAKGIGLA